jgi:hypothetical protein
MSIGDIQSPTPEDAWNGLRGLQRSKNGNVGCDDSPDGIVHRGSRLAA